MHLLDGFALAIDTLGKGEKCKYKPASKNWKANLDGDSSKLATKLGNKPDAATADEVSATQWPSQAHHLIPHKTLKPHFVADLLKKGKVLYEDANYDVDHPKNGMWLPYASSLPEWKTRGAEARRQLMFYVMEQSGFQLHQGPHSEKKYAGAEEGYKARVKQYLKKMRNNALSHYAGPMQCPDCKSKANGGKYPATAQTTSAVDLASSCLKQDILDCRIFVSRIASEFASVGGFK